MNFFGKKIKKLKNLCGAVTRTPQRDPQNLCLQGKLMALTLRLAADGVSILVCRGAESWSGLAPHLGTARWQADMVRAGATTCLLAL